MKEFVTKVRLQSIDPVTKKHEEGIVVKINRDYKQKISSIIVRIIDSEGKERNIKVDPWSVEIIIDVVITKPLKINKLRISIV